MAGTYKTPGVKIEEISKFPPSVASVETAIPAFIGFTQKAEKNGIDLVGIPTRIKSLAEYEEWFGTVDPTVVHPGETLPDIRINVNVTIENNALTSVVPTLDPTSIIFRMYYSLQVYFANGGGPCYIVSAALIDTLNIATQAEDSLKTAIGNVKYEDEPTLFVLPDAHLVNSAYAKYYGLYQLCLTQSATLGDRFTIIDLLEPIAVSDDPVDKFRNEGLSDLKYGAAYYPNIKTTFTILYEAANVTVNEVVDTVAGTPAYSSSALNLKDLEYNAIKDKIRALIKVELPPGSAMAGIYARVDSERGVWKAPANVPVLSVLETKVKIDDEDQKGLNVDTEAGKSVNAIRFFTGKGILVWGARTLAGNDNEWRYISVRRLYNMVEESIKKASSWVVFEPNDSTTWGKVKSMISNYLTTLWRQGALAGPTPEAAFFVKCGLGETMTALDILEGRLNVEIGMAAVRPAEFIIMKFSHKLQEA